MSWVRDKEATQQTSELTVRSFAHQERRKMDHFWTCWLRYQEDSWIFRLRAQRRALGWPGVLGSPGDTKVEHTGGDEGEGADEQAQSGKLRPVCV